VARTKLTKEQRTARQAARLEIIQAANRHKVRVRYQPVLFGARHLQQAVHMVRQHRLVKPKVLAAAGFREHR
jgi:hypothetical protein